MGTIASQITSLTIVFSTVYLDTDQRKHQSSASLAFLRGIRRRPVNSPHKGPVTRKMFPFDDVIKADHTVVAFTFLAPCDFEFCFVDNTFLSKVTLGGLMATGGDTLLSPGSNERNRQDIRLNTLRPRQNGRHFADDTFNRIFLNENARISIKFSLKFVPKDPINNIRALVQIMAWRRPGDKPLSEPVMVGLLTHICVTRPQ